MIQKKNKFILSAIAFGALFSMSQSIQAYTGETEMATIPIEKIEEIEMINIRELGQNANKYSFISERQGNFKTVILSGNGRVAEFKESSPFVMVDGKRVPLETSNTKDGARLPMWSDGIHFDGVDVYAPANVILEVFELMNRNGEVVYEKEVVQPVEQRSEKEDDLEFFRLDDFRNVEDEEDHSEESTTPTEAEEKVIDEKDPKDETPVDEVELPEDGVHVEDIEENEKVDEVDEVEDIIDSEKPIEEDLEETDEDVADKDWDSFVDHLHNLVKPLDSIVDTQGNLVLNFDLKEPKQTIASKQTITWLKEQPYAFEIKELESSLQIIIKRSLN